MKKLILSVSGNATWVVLLTLTTWGCQENDSMSPEEQQFNAEVSAEDNSQIIATTQEVLNLTEGAMTESGIINGRVAKGGHKNIFMGCLPEISSSFDVDKSHEDSIIFRGMIAIDYGDGSTCDDTVRVRTGKVMDSFIRILSFSDSTTFSSTDSITFEAFKKDSIGIEGLFVKNYASGQPYTLSAQGAQITYSDGSFVSWDGTLSFTYDDNGTKWDWNDDSRVMTGSISGTTRNGASFTAEVTDDVMFKNECFWLHKIPVSGTIEITSDGVTSVIDYGDGTCDKTYTITVNGETTEYEFDYYHKHHHDHM